MHDVRSSVVITFLAKLRRCVSALPHVSSKSSDEEKEMLFFLLARVERFPVTSRSHVTDKCKISIITRSELASLAHSFYT